MALAGVRRDAWLLRVWFVGDTACQRFELPLAMNYIFEITEIRQMDKWIRNLFRGSEIDFIQ